MIYLPLALIAAMLFPATSSARAHHYLRHIDDDAYRLDAGADVFSPRIRRCDAPNTPVALLGHDGVGPPRHAG